MTETVSTTGTVGEMGLINERIMVCTDAWIDTMSDDGPEPMSSWREVAEGEKTHPHYARLVESLELTRRQEEIWARNRAAEQRAVAARMRVTGEAARAAADYATRPVRSDDLKVVTQEDEDLLNDLFG